MNSQTPTLCGLKAGDINNLRGLRQARLRPLFGISVFLFAAVIMIGSGDRPAYADGAGVTPGPVQFADTRRPGIEPGSPRPGTSQTLPETQRDRQRPGYRPGYRPGAFERYPRLGCQDNTQSSSPDCR